MNQSTSLITKAWNYMKDHQEHVTADPYRLHYHLMAPVGLLNDPNGFVFFQGRYHLFFQWNPFETNHGKKFWGHYISDDLIHWKLTTPALAPDQWYDKDGCYSGSAIVNDDKLYIFYTGNVKNKHGDRESYQCLAISKDGHHFYKEGPIIHLPDGYTPHFRDPKVFYKNNSWYMVVGAQTQNLESAVVLYASKDLRQWTFQGKLAGSADFGTEGLGYMWECPDLFELGDSDILIISPQGLEPNGYYFNNIYQAGYLSGSVDYASVSYEHGEFNELDRGFDFYAPQTTEASDGRRLLIAWMGNAEDGETQHPTAKYDWVHALTVPRTLEYKDGKIRQHPIEELTKLRTSDCSHLHVTLKDEEKKLKYPYDNTFELQLSIEEWSASRFQIMFGTTTFTYDETTRTCTLERMRFDQKGIEKRHCHLSALSHIQVYKDTSSVEVFLNKGEETFSARIFDKANEGHITFRTEGHIAFKAHQWKLKTCVNSVDFAI
ncbi:sucrose-6-phosphate hydrolase [Lentibacillus cibarius]|uniref:Sucrose-6-phosphate hydrolase n=1 Tax=Lentibacillus cibarius TaxID=2583219 RepID=A0A549YF08_9BACI|nr:sucrose-6-phosphate hydrolase [Lentibacillus cibarius]TMN21538.1 sucrose-6-phosphate hydrolase [Lentibacillus cibarius]TRM10438.1 sucrose-6-phosphate hydrolase [Lentibacillus cibarius]